MSHEAFLGLATTKELLTELMARVEVNGTADYRTVGDSFESNLRDLIFPDGKLHLVFKAIDLGMPSPDLCFVEIEDSAGRSHNAGSDLTERADGFMEIVIDLAHELKRRTPLTVAHHQV